MPSSKKAEPLWPSNYTKLLKTSYNLSRNEQIRMEALRCATLCHVAYECLDCDFWVMAKRFENYIKDGRD